MMKRSFVLFATVISFLLAFDENPRVSAQTPGKTGAKVVQTRPVFQPPVQYLEVTLQTNGRGWVVAEKSGRIEMPSFSGSRLIQLRWTNRKRVGTDGFFVGANGVIGKRLLDSQGRVSAAFLVSEGASEILLDIDRDGLVELSVLNSAQGVVRFSVTGDAGWRSFRKLADGQNPLCTGGPRSSTQAEREAGSASGCIPRGGNTSGVGGRDPRTVGRDPLDLACAGFDPQRAAFSGGTRGSDPENPLSLTERLLDFARDGLPGQSPTPLEQAERFVIMSPIIGFVAVLEFSAHEILGGGIGGTLARETARISEQRREREAAAGGSSSGTPPETPAGTTPPERGGNTSRPGPEGGNLYEGGLASMCGSRGQPSLRQKLRATVDQAMNECPNPVALRSPSPANRETAVCMSSVFARRLDARQSLDIVRGLIQTADYGCNGSDSRCITDRTAALRQLVQRASTYLGSRFNCDPATCQPPIQ
jgi:hypothetical protein